MEIRSFFRKIWPGYLTRYYVPVPFSLGFIAIVAFIYDFGYTNPGDNKSFIHFLYIIALIAAIPGFISRISGSKSFRNRKIAFVDTVFFVYIIILLLGKLLNPSVAFFANRQWTFIALLIIVIRENASFNFYLKRKHLNPAQLFIFSFILVILAGAYLLKLPNSTHHGISFVDALFTSTSAVCVTGLTVVDTGTSFTSVGQTIIILLIQLGGLGVLTLTSYFSYFFKGNSSFENQLLLKDLSNASRITDIFETLKRVILITLIIETVGALIIFMSIDHTVIENVGDRAFFALFHSISAFCNAGFSTFRNNLYEISIRYNYLLQLTIAFLIIIGGIGFPIVLNFLHYLKHLLVNRLIPYLRGIEPKHMPWVININTRLVVITTLILLVSGTVFIYIFEYHNTLAEHKAFGKIVTAFACSVTPRTAGFNSVDMASLNFYTIMLIFFLMWIGGSPGSTAGGIKTSTIAIAFLNFISLAQGKERIEIFRREISNDSVKRAFATITLSLIAVGISIIMLTYFDNDKDLKAIAFECFSALGTVGLSLGITPDLSSPGKYTLVLTMLAGRVGMITILLAIIRRIKYRNYHYATEDIMIN